MQSCLFPKHYLTFTTVSCWRPSLVSSCIVSNGSFSLHHEQCMESACLPWKGTLGVNDRSNYCLLVIIWISYKMCINISSRVSGAFLLCHWLSSKRFISNQLSCSALVFVSTLCCIQWLWDALHCAFALFRETGFTASEQCDKPG